VYEARKALDFTMRLTVHDELCGDLRNPEKLGAITSLLNEQRFPLKVPILWDVKTGSNWAACK
jgi:DNA polymerase I-like protein with 3'-5' exonuclease and polymerase domains